MASAGSSNLKSSGDETEDAASPHLADARYSFEPEKLQELRSSSPWMKDPKYLKKVALSPSAIMKIMMHCHSGVEKGIAKGGNPIEVMGMLLGRPDPLTPDTLVVTDAFPLPIEGFETRVIADDENVVNHMIALGESLEVTRKEKFMGWYHSHPFDLGDHSHCFLSQTDLSTELQWQRAEDPHGNPFVAIVVDPLRSGHLQEPELKAFRAYPPEYNSPVTDECPNGSIESSEQLRLEQWGSCWNRYYELEVEYYMSNTSRKVLEQLTQDYLWMRTLNSQPEANLTTKLVTAGKQFKAAASTASAMSMSSSTAAASAPTAPAANPTRPYSRVRADQGMAAMPSTGTTGGVTSTPVPAKSKEWTKAVNQLVDAASDQLCEASLQRTKEQVFS
jgi:COP9 signalosome complex subunit 5